MITFSTRERNLMNIKSMLIIPSSTSHEFLLVRYFLTMAIREETLVSLGENTLFPDWPIAPSCFPVILAFLILYPPSMKEIGTPLSLGFTKGGIESLSKSLFVISANTLIDASILLHYLHVNKKAIKI